MYKKTRKKNMQTHYSTLFFCISSESFSETNYISSINPSYRNKSRLIAVNHQEWSGKSIKEDYILKILNFFPLQFNNVFSASREY